MPVLRPLPTLGRRRVLAVCGSLAILLGACAAAAGDDGPRQPAAAPVESIAAAIPHEDLAARASALVHQGRWADVVSICETAARKGTLAPSLRHQYDLAKLHCDVARRHSEPAFRGQAATLPEVDARRLYAEVLSDRKSTRLNSSHVSESRMPSSA